MIRNEGVTHSRTTGLLSMTPTVIINFIYFLFIHLFIIIIIVNNILLFTVYYYH